MPIDRMARKALYFCQMAAGLPFEYLQWATSEFQKPSLSK